MSENTLDKGIRLAQQATQADECGDAAGAFELYKQAINYLMLAIKYEKNEALCKRVQEKILAYVERAEQLGAPQTVSEQNGGGGEKQQQFDLSHVIVVDKPVVKWEAIAGLKAAKEALQEAVVLPLLHPALFVGRVKPWSGVLLYGPPGTGKTHLARAVACNAETTFLCVSSADLVSKWLGESEKLVRNLFALAREKAPSVIFIDEVESLGGARDDGRDASGIERLKTQFLQEMQGLQDHGEKHVLVLGATNLPWQLDGAIKRRFERRIYIPLPDRMARAHLFALNVPMTNIVTSEWTADQFEKLADASEGYSGADIAIAVRDALMEPIRIIQRATHFAPDTETGRYRVCAPDASGAQSLSWRDVPKNQLEAPPLLFSHVMGAVLRTPRSVDPDSLARYDEWTRQFGLH